MNWLRDKGMWIAIAMLVGFTTLIIVKGIWHWGTFPIWLGDFIMVIYIIKKTWIGTR